MSSSAASLAPAEYVWKFPGSPIRIHIPLDVISQLRSQLNLERTAEPENACECGGLLLGAVENSRVHITDFEPFSLEPGQRNFILSEAQKLQLEKVIAGRRGKTKTAAVVGYYRSDLRGGIQLRAQDLALIDTLFVERSDVFLVICSSDMGNSMVGCFFRVGGLIFEVVSFM